METLPFKKELKNQFGNFLQADCESSTLIGVNYMIWQQAEFDSHLIFTNFCWAFWAIVGDLECILVLLRLLNHGFQESPNWLQMHSFERMGAQAIELHASEVFTVSR